MLMLMFITLNFEMQGLPRHRGLTRETQLHHCLPRNFMIDLVVMKTERTSYLGHLKDINGQCAEEFLSMYMMGEEHSFDASFLTSITASGTYIRDIK